MDDRVCGVGELRQIGGELCVIFGHPRKEIRIQIRSRV